MNDVISNFTGDTDKKLAKVYLALSLALCACLLAGCTITIAPIESTAEAQSSSVAQQNGTEQTDPGEQPSSEPSTSSQGTHPAEEPQHTEEATEPASSGQQSLSEEAELAQFSQFWQEACIGNLVNEPCGEDFSQYQQNFWLLSSIYLKNKAQATGNEPPCDANGVAYFPVDEYVGTLEALFGDGLDYRSILPDMAGPEEGTLLACSGYSFGYVVADLDSDSFSLQDNIISVDANRIWREPGYTKELGTIQYKFEIQPGNPYSRYRFISITGDDIAS